MESIKRAAEAITYIPPTDRELPADQQTKIVLRPMTQAERMAALDDEDSLEIGSDEPQIIGRRWRRNYRLARDHIVAVENFPIGQPKAWPASGSIADKIAYLELMPEAAVFLIGQEVFEKSVLPVAVKN